ncbi:MAG: hypothetical protein V4474_01445 [Patescibacteria group bacterium]
MFTFALAIDAPNFCWLAITEALQEPYRPGEVDVIEFKMPQTHYATHSLIEQRAINLMPILQTKSQAEVYVVATSGTVVQGQQHHSTARRYDYAHVRHMTGLTYGQPLKGDPVHVPQIELGNLSRTPREIIIALKHFLVLQCRYLNGKSINLVAKSP